MERKLPLGFKTIVARWITIPKKMAMTLRQLATEYSRFIVDKKFGAMVCTSVKHFKIFLKFFLLLQYLFNLSVQWVRNW